MKPLISVVMPVYNAECYLEAALQSVFYQSCADFELLALDDASTDASRDILQSFSDPRLRIIANFSNQGVSKTLNRGLEQAQGQFIARMDADDICEPLRFERQIQFLQAHAQICVCGSWVTDIDRNGRTIQLRAMPAGARLNTFWWRPSPLSHPSAMWSVEKQKWRYDENLGCAQDYDLWLKLGLNGEKLGNIEESLLRYRVHEASISGRQASQQTEQTLESFNRQTGLALSREVFLSLNFWNVDVAPQLRARAMRQVRARIGQKYNVLHLRDEIRYLQQWSRRRLRLASRSKKSDNAQTDLQRTS